MNKKGISKMILVAIIIVVVLVVGIAAYLVMSSGGGGNGTSASPSPSQSPSPTASESASPSASTSPSPSPSLSPSPTPSGNGNGGTDVAGASSLQFSVSVTQAGVGEEVATYSVKNAGTSSMMMRIDMNDVSSEDFVYIINGVQEKAWIYSEGEWTDLSVAYTTYWDTWNSAWQGYRDSLSDWTGLGDWSYTSPEGDTVRIYDIDVNPSLPDSMFQPD